MPFLRAALIKKRPQKPLAKTTAHVVSRKDRYKKLGKDGRQFIIVFPK